MGKTRHHSCGILISPSHWHHSRAGLCPALRTALRSGPQLRKVLPAQLWKGGKDDHYLKALIWNHELTLFHDFKNLTLNGKFAFLLSPAFKFSLLGKQWQPATHRETSRCPRLCQVTAGRKPRWAVWTMTASGQWVFDLHIPEVMCAALQSPFSNQCVFFLHMHAFPEGPNLFLSMYIRSAANTWKMMSKKILLFRFNRRNYCLVGKWVIIF